MLNWNTGDRSQTHVYRYTPTVTIIGAFRITGIFSRLQSFYRQRIPRFLQQVTISRRFHRRQYRLSSFMRFCKAEAERSLVGRQMR